MSTVITPGWSLAIEPCLWYIKRRWTKFAVEAKALARQLITTAVLTEAVSGLDNDGDYDSLNQAWHKALQEYRKDHTIYQEYHVDFTATFFMPKDGSLLAMTHSNGDYDRLWCKHFSATDYSYWNNTDKPDEVSAKEWRTRERVWNQVMGETFCPATEGFGIQLLGTYGCPALDFELIKKILPPFDVRVKDAAFNLALAQKVKKMTRDGSGHMHSYFEAKKWLETDDGQKAYKKIAIKVADKLVPQADLYNTLVRPNGETVD